MSISPTAEELVALFQQGLLGRELPKLFSVRCREYLRNVEKLCIDLHNSDAIDLLQLVELGSFKELPASEFFTVMHPYCHFLPHLKAVPARMMTCVESLVAQGGNDLAANLPNAAFRSWCINNPQLADEIVSAARGGDELASRHLTFALEAANSIAMARKIALEYEDKRSVSAITALSRMKDDDAVSRAETLAVFSTIIDTSAAEEVIYANLLGAIAAVLRQSPDMHSASALILIRRILVDPSGLIVHAAAKVMCDDAIILTPEIVTCLLTALLRLNPENKGTILQLDIGLHSLLDHGHAEAAIDYVTTYFSKENNVLRLEEIPTFTSALINGPSERLSRVVVLWLLNGIPALCDGLSNAMKGRGMEGKPIYLLAEDLAITPSEQIFLCRKAIGWFFIKPITATSILVSVLRVCDEETALEVQKLLVQNLLENYGGVRKYLESIAQDDPAKDRVEKCVSVNEAYISALNSVPLIKELQPSEHHRRIERLRVADQMHDVHKQARNQSPFLSMVKRSVLLYGNRSLSFR
ncbi:MAG: hypothetical protein Q7V04_02930, partial [Deltaproteobacteria bacterium]|nr:hypothetical protein [Deltaproteobacteria bacterium]